MKEFLRKDKLTQLMFSVPLALLLWVVAISNVNPQVVKSFSEVPVTFLNLDELIAKGLIAENLNETVYIRLSGQNSQFLRFRKSDIKATIDLSDINAPGNHSLNVKIEGLPIQVSVTDVTPVNIVVEVSRIVSKSSNFTIARNGTASAGYEIMSVKSDVTVVEISGSTNSVSKAAEIKGFLDISDASSDYKAQVVLHAYDQDGKIIDSLNISPAFIDVSVQVGKFKTVPLKAEIFGECASGYYVFSAEISPAEIKIAAKEEDLEKITSVTLSSIDVSGKSESFSAAGTVNLPPNVMWLDTEDIEVKVNISPYESATFTLTNSIQVTNTPPGLKCSPVKFENITVTVIAEPGGLAGITAEDINLSIDLAGLRTGTFEIEIKFELPKGIILKDTSRNKVTVTISEP